MIVHLFCAGLWPQASGLLMRIAILTVSDAGSRGEREDRSGDVVVAWATGRGDRVVDRQLVPDESAQIIPVLLGWCDKDQADLILTTGGTGLSPRDITPEATRVVLEREAPGIAERLRVSSIPRAMAREAPWVRTLPAPVAPGARSRASTRAWRSPA